MPKSKNHSLEVSKNTFGKLVRAYREQRGWTQERLAAKWGYTREYVSQIESGSRKLDRIDQVIRLADILEIPYERLEAIGKSIPHQKIIAEKLQEADDVLLQAILEPAQTTVKLSWLVWYGNNDTSVIDNLTRITTKLEDAITNRRGILLKPALELLAYCHEMQGKIAFDKLNYTAANGHFHEMHQLGEELKNPDIIALAMLHQGDILRRKGRYELAIRCLKAAIPYADAGSLSTRGLLWQILARTYAEYGYKPLFLEAIDNAQEAATNLQPGLDATSNQFNLVDVIQERAQGHTLLWEPEKAIEIYKESERLKPFRPMRDLGVLTILKAQAFSYTGAVDEGVKYALKGLELARGYESKRHISRVQRMYDRLSVTSLASHQSLKDLNEALRQR